MKALPRKLGRSAARAGAPASLVLVASLAGCPAGEVDPAPAESAAPKPQVRAATEKGTAAPARAPVKGPLAPKPWRIPVGPSLPIEPGKGLGPIRFGARLDTVERLIGEPCEQKREAPSGAVECRYSAHAVEFTLEGGVVTRMHAHRLGRRFKPGSPLEFGIFNGRFLEGAAFGMLMPAVQELLGKPKQVRRVDEKNAYGTVEVHDYGKFSLEYDELSPGRVVLGGVILTR